MSTFANERKLDMDELERVAGGAGQEEYEIPPCSDPRNQVPEPTPTPTPIPTPRLTF